LHATASPAREQGRIVSESLRLAAGSFATLVLGCGVFSYLSRRLGVEAYGDYSVAFVLGVWCTELLGMVSGGAVAYMIAAHTDGDRFATTVLRGTLVSGVLLAGVVMVEADAIAAWFESPSLGGPLRWIAPGIPLAALGHVHRMAAIGRGRYRSQVAMQIGSLACRLLCAIGLVEAGAGAAGAAAAVSLSDGVLFLAARRLSGVGLLGPAMPLPEVIARSRLVIGSGLVSRALFSMDLIAVKFLAPGPTAAGLYAAAQNLCLIPWLGFANSAGLVAQAIAVDRRDHGGRSVVPLATGYLRTALLAAGLTIAVIPVTPAIATLLLGSRYANAAPVAAVLLVASALRMMALAGRAISGGLGESTVYSIGLTTLACVGVAGFVHRAPEIAARFAARGIEPMVAYAIVTASLALATALGCLAAGTVMARVAFPWIALVRTVLACAVAAAIGWILPWTGLGVFPRLAAVSAVFAAIATLLGDRSLIGGVGALVRHVSVGRPAPTNSTAP